jgi:SAM-dependent methyltransferase
MKKDYMPVAETETGLSETDFIDRFWTGIWQNTEPTFLAATIERREPFQVMRPFFSKLPPDSRILDGGCGLGDWTLYYASKGFQVVGLDLSRVTIEKLNELFPGQHFKTGDIRKTEFEDNFFDIYFSWGTFEHFENGLGEPLREARRILKPGGYLFITVPFQNGRHLSREKHALQCWDENYDPGKGYQSKMRFYQWRLTRPELQRELEINGFKTLKVQPVDKWHGLYRMLELDYHINTSSKFGSWLHSKLYRLVPEGYASHMLMGVAQKIA